MKIKTLHAYQAVRFNKKDETHFIDNKHKGMEGLTMRWLPDMMAVLIEMPDVEPVFVFATNIAYAVPESLPAETSKKSKKAELDLNKI